MAKSEKAKSPSKSEIVTGISESTGLSRKDVTAVMEALGNEIKKALGNRGAGVFAIPAW